MVFFRPGERLRQAVAHATRCKALTIHCPGMTVNLDGELIPCDVAKFVLLENALRVRKCAQNA